MNIDITGCAAGITGADVLFSGEADTLAPTLLKLTDTGGSGGMATGIAVQILDAQSQQEIPLNQIQPLTPLKAGDNTLKYQLRYKSTKAGATGGNATAVLYLIWFTSEGVMLKRIIWILFLLGLTGAVSYLPMMAQSTLADRFAVIHACWHRIASKSMCS